MDTTALSLPCDAVQATLLKPWELEISQTKKGSFWKSKRVGVVFLSTVSFLSLATITATCATIFFQSTFIPHLSGALMPRCLQRNAIGQLLLFPSNDRLKTALPVLLAGLVVPLLIIVLAGKILNKNRYNSYCAYLLAEANRHLVKDELTAVVQIVAEKAWEHKYNPSSRSWGSERHPLELQAALFFQQNQLRFALAEKYVLRDNSHAFRKALDHMPKDCVNDQQEVSRKQLLEKIAEKFEHIDRQFLSRCNVEMEPCLDVLAVREIVLSYLTDENRVIFLIRSLKDLTHHQMCRFETIISIIQNREIFNNPENAPLKEEASDVLKAAMVLELERRMRRW